MSCGLQIGHPKTFEVNQKPTRTHKTPLLFRSRSHLFHGMWFQNHWAPDPLFPWMLNGRHLETTNDGSMSKSNPCCRNYGFKFIHRFYLCFPKAIFDNTIFKAPGWSRSESKMFLSKFRTTCKQDENPWKTLHLWAHHKENLLNLAACLYAT